MHTLYMCILSCYSLSPNYFTQKCYLGLVNTDSFNFRPDLQFVYSDKVVKEVIRPDWQTIMGQEDRTVTMMVTPKVTVSQRKNTCLLIFIRSCLLSNIWLQAEVRDHFNCQTLEGAELENQGPQGTKLTHWEKRVFEV